MKDKEKVGFRAKTLMLIEKLDGQLQQDYQCECSEPVLECDQFARPLDFGDPDGCNYLWSYKYHLDPVAPKTIELISIIDELCEMINSREGVRGYPKGLYRELVDFGDKCMALKQSINGLSGSIRHDSTTKPPQNGEILDAANKGMRTNMNSYHAVIRTMKRSIYYYENERADSEKSFFETVE